MADSMLPPEASPRAARPSPAPAPAPAQTAAPAGSADAGEPAWKSAYLGARRAFMLAAGLVFGSFLLALVGGRVHLIGSLGGLGVLAGFVVLLVAGIRAVIALYRMAGADGPVGWSAPLEALAVAAMAGFGIIFALGSVMMLSRGRQLRKRGKVLLPPLAPEGGWSALGLGAEVPPDTRAALAARWRENGRTEHASVAAFARLTLDLMALGAPPELISDANRDARDEIRHAELCFSLARAIDGRDVGPGRFPEARTARTLAGVRTLALAELAVDSLVDGALHEGLSARVISVLARRCELPAARSVLKELAADEARHSAHGWDVVVWCLAEGGAPVAHALRAAAAVLPEEPATELPAEARDGSWERFGIHGEALERAQYARCVAVVRSRVAALTNAGRPAAAAR